MTPLTNEQRIVAAFEAVASDESKSVAQVVEEFIAGYEGSRPDPWVVLDWLAANNPGALELCPFKVRRG